LPAARRRHAGPRYAHHYQLRLAKPVAGFSFDTFMNTSDPFQDLISLSEASELFGLGADYLRQLVLRGRLKARKIGRNWITTRGDVEAFIQSRKKMGAYRDDLKSGPKKVQKPRQK
jgi:excisionase family DNA binding protein